MMLKKSLMKMNPKMAMRTCSFLALRAHWKLVKCHLISSNSFIFHSFKFIIRSFIFFRNEKRSLDRLRDLGPH